MFEFDSGSLGGWLSRFIRLREFHQSQAGKESTTQNRCTGSSNSLSATVMELVLASFDRGKLRMLELECKVFWETRASAVNKVPLRDTLHKACRGYSAHVLSV
ncbi:hypothetical protein VTL71DRAFT_11027 [Oculimacula yallundae]|uniref:Uncharacterized protein n=1 Tax=Oculimacula yallundae TaxID=86028 RepID=A0ABR4CW75_9HELO